MDAFLTQSALDGASLHVNASAPGISSEALERLVTDYRRVLDIIARLTRLYPQRVLEELRFVPRLTTAQLSQRDRVEQWIAALAERFAGERRSGDDRFLFHAVEDTERHESLAAIEMISHGVSTHYVLDRDFISSNDYAEMTRVGEMLTGLLETDAFVKRGEKTRPVTDFEGALAWLMNEAKRGYSMQRYKGLGEMNPEQLWETTMDAGQRRLLRVTIEDAIAADQLFNTLMGDQVEPRREFIETNALSVANLDV